MNKLLNKLPILLSLIIVIYGIAGKFLGSLDTLMVIIGTATILVAYNYIEILSSGLNTVYSEGYLKTLTDTMEIAIIEMRYIEGVYPHECDYSKQLKNIEGCLTYLQSIEPPTRYETKHEDIINELASFIEEYKKP